MSVDPCTPLPVTPGIVVFDPTAFIADFPSFATVSTSALTFNFNTATLLLENSCCSVVKDANQREALLNLITAHITALLNGINGEPPQGVVGRVASATEGSVSVQAELVSKSESASFYAQTPWGLLYWQATLPFRTARYIPPSRCGGEFLPFDAWPT